MLAVNTFAQTIELDTKASSLKWVGKKVGGSHNGTVAIESGSFELEGGKITQGVALVDLTTIEDDDMSIFSPLRGKLVKHLKSEDFFDVERFPKAKFELKSFEVGEGGKTKVKGNLSVRGKTKPIEFLVDYKKSENEHHVLGKVTLDRTEWGLTFRSGKFFEKLGDKLIYDDFEVELDLKATEKAKD